MHPDELTAFIAKYRTKGIVVDTNLLLVWLVGRYDLTYLSRFKRTSAYGTEDFFTLAAILDSFSTIVTTPNILTEVSNLSRRIPPKYFQEFRKQVRIFDEKYVPSQSVLSTKDFERFGLTDLVIAALSKKRYLVVTADLDLWLLLQKTGVDAINFNHIRAMLRIG